MIEEAKLRLVQLDEELDLYNEMGIQTGQKLNGKLGSIKKAVSDLKDLIKHQPFNSVEEEVHFFKYVKPQFIARQLFAVDVFTIEASKPIGTANVVKSYFEQELNYLRKFSEQHKFIHQYFLLDSNELDRSLFVRNAQPPVSLIPEVQGFDPEFSTAGDYVFARFIATEKIHNYLIPYLYSPEEMESLSSLTKRKNKLKWTGDKLNLIELAYGIYDTMQINDGNVTIAEIIEWLEESLAIDLNRYYRRFSEIKMRKTLSKTKYLDEMAEALNKHIIEGDSFKPTSQKTAIQAK
jgi:hypothetical protein